jgi:hypothetical protein
MLAFTMGNSRKVCLLPCIQGPNEHSTEQHVNGILTLWLSVYPNVARRTQGYHFSSPRPQRFGPESSSTAKRRPILPKHTQLQNSTLPTQVTTAKLS